MKHLTMGGIVSGIGGGSGSWKEGAFHDAVVDCDIVLANGCVLEKISEKSDDHNDLFHALPGSLGTLGYITRIRMETIPLKEYVLTRNIRCRTLQEFIKCVHDNSDADFIDGTAFAPNHIVCVLGYKYQNVSSKMLQVDNFVNHKIYWKALRDTKTESMHKFKLMDYIYRWETDLYYTTMNPKLPGIFRTEWLRPMIPPNVIPTIKDAVASVMPINIDNVCADVMIPMSKADSFWQFYTKQKESIYPVYLCPAQSHTKPGATFWTGEPLLDFGIGYGVLPETQEQQNTLRMAIERKMMSLGGRKLPYSYHSLNQNEFWSTRGGELVRLLYEKLRQKYKAEHLPNVYKKLNKKKQHKRSP